MQVEGRAERNASDECNTGDEPNASDERNAGDERNATQVTSEFYVYINGWRGFFNDTHSANIACI